jgi:hypothetical protein
MRKTVLVAFLSSFPLGCSPGQSSSTAASAREAPPPPLTSSNAAAPTASSVSAARAPIACSSAGLAAANDACLSQACAEIPADMKTCQSNSDCVVDTFASCECAYAAPYYSVRAQSHSEARERFRGKYASECNCACPRLAPACVEGTCGLRYP